MYVMLRIWFKPNIRKLCNLCTFFILFYFLDNYDLVTQKLCHSTTKNVFFSHCRSLSSLRGNPHARSTTESECKELLRVVRVFLLYRFVSRDPYIPHWCTGPSLYISFCSAKYLADSYSLKRNKRTTTVLFFSFCFFIYFFSFFLFVSQERIAHATPRMFLLPFGLLLHSALPFAPFELTELPRLFFLREPLPTLRRTLFFFLVPLSYSLFFARYLLGRFFRAFFLSFSIFLFLHFRIQSRGIMQRITEKSKQAQQNSPESLRLWFCIFRASLTRASFSVPCICAISTSELLNRKMTTKFNGNKLVLLQSY